MSPPAYSLTAAERTRMARVDEIVARAPPDAVEALLAMLADPSWTVRRAVTAALGALGDDAVPALCSALARDRQRGEHVIAATADALVSSIGPTAIARVLELAAGPVAAVAEDAVRILGRRRAPEAVALLGQLLEHDDDNVALAAIEALGAIGGTASTEALVAVVRSRKFFRAFPAMQVAAHTGDPRVVAALAELLDDDAFRVEAARALGRTGSAQAIAALTSLLHGAEDPTVRLLAIALADLAARAEWSGTAEQVATAMRATFRGHASRFAAALRGGDREERLAVIYVLGLVGDAGTIEVLAPVLEDPQLRAAATLAVQRIATSDGAALVAAFASGDPLTRAAVLPVAHTSRAAPSVRALLDDDDAEVRARACDALARIGDTHAVPALFAALDDPSPHVAHTAIAAIHSLATADTPALAIAALASTRPNLRRHALRIIGYLGSTEAFDAVRAAIGDSDPRVAELAVAALASIDDPRVDDVVTEVSRTTDEALRAAAMRAAGQRGGERMVALLARGLNDDAAWVRYYACQGQGRIGHDAASGALIARLADPAPHVRVAAIEALARLTTTDAWQALMASARSADPDAQRAALVGLGASLRPGAVEVLLEAAQATAVATRLIAFAGLARSADPRALDVLARGARDPIDEVRDAALSLLAERADREASDLLIETALACAPDHPAHAVLSIAAPVRIDAIAARLVVASDREAPVLAAALARMHDETATRALFTALFAPSPAARRAAASTLVALDADGARLAVRRAATDDPDPEVRRVCAAAVAR